MRIGEYWYGAVMGLAGFVSCDKVCFRVFVLESRLNEKTKKVKLRIIVLLEYDEDFRGTILKSHILSRDG